MKLCKKCGASKPLGEFTTDKRSRDGRDARCRQCRREFRRAWGIRTNYRQGAGRRRSGPSTLQLRATAYASLFEKQGGLCAVCGRREQGRALSIDHCHTTGRIRGLLCRRCNTGIGLLYDSPQLLRSAIAYLEGAPNATDSLSPATETRNRQ